MTALNSAGKFTRFGTYYLYKLRSLRTLIILQSIFAVLAYPMISVLGSVYSHIYSDIYYKGREYPLTPEELQLLHSWESICAAAAVICVISLVCIFFMNYAVSLKAFRYLHKKTLVDMDYSLPVSDNTRFFGDFLASLTSAVGPYIISSAIGITVWFSFFNRELFEDGRGTMELVDKLIVQGVITGLVVCVMFMGICLFMMSLCGRTAENSLYSFAMNIAVPVIHALCILLALSNVYGYSQSSSYKEYESVAVTSPFGFIAITLVRFSGLFSMTFYTSTEVGFREYVNAFSLPVAAPNIIIPTLLVTAAFFAGAYFLIKNRRNERVGSPFVYGAVRVIVMAVIVFAVTSLFVSPIYSSYGGEGIGYMIALIIITFIMYTVMELISGRGFKKFYLTLGKWVLTLAVSFGICTAVNFSGAFGLAYSVPSANEISSVSISLYSYDYRFHDFSLYLQQPEQIQDIIDLHTSIPKQSLKTDVDYANLNASISIRYNYKDTTDRRYYYDISQDQYDEYLRALAKYELLYTDNSNVYVLKESERITNLIYHSDSIGAYGPDPNGLKARELYDALVKDSEKATYENMCRVVPQEYTVFMSFVADETEWGYINLHSWCTETLAVLSSHGIEVDFGADIDKYDDAFLVKYRVGTYDRHYLSLYRSDLYREDDYYGDTYDKSADSNEKAIVKLPIDSADVQSLMELGGSGYDVYGSDMDVYVLALTTNVLDDQWGYYLLRLNIPLEYNDMAAEIFNRYAQ